MSKKHITKNIVTSSVSEFQRLEIKYLISNNIVDILIPDLLQHLEYDSYSINGEYDIFSVYFDTQDLQAFEAKMAGNNKRQKFRIR
ncbi:VTC domain-containing protein, partial [Candidatus Saccharibacteria bacterium]|nr:VTC domain-containing protein [Candidatus Saccharibacteria bacterium]